MPLPTTVPDHNTEIALAELKNEVQQQSESYEKESQEDDEIETEALMKPEQRANEDKRTLDVKKVEISTEKTEESQAQHTEPQADLYKSLAIRTDIKAVEDYLEILIGEIKGKICCFSPFV